MTRELTPEATGRSPHEMTSELSVNDLLNREWRAHAALVQTTAGWTAGASG